MKVKHNGLHDSDCIGNAVDCGGIPLGMLCGCEVTGLLRGPIRYCPLHAKAPEMLAALATLVESLQWAEKKWDITLHGYETARDLLREIEGA